MQIMNNCTGTPTYYQFFFKPENCTYPLVTNFISVKDLDDGKLCFLIQTVSLKVSY